MNSSAPFRYSLSIGAAVWLAGCGGSQLPVGAPGAMPQTSAIATRAEGGKSWMSPEVKSGDLLYVSYTDDHVNVFTYPQGSLVQELVGFSGPSGECVDKSRDVFIVNSGTGSGTVQPGILEYAHGGTAPINTLGIPNGYTPWGCAIDPTTGNLAVTVNSSGEDGLAIFQNASGTPTISSTGYLATRFCTYDDHGNLFVDGQANQSLVGFIEFPAGQKTFKQISLNKRLLY